MSDRELLEEISKKLSLLVGILLQRDGQAKVQENVERLSNFGLSGTEIAQILGTTAGTVAVAKNRIKKARSK
jgi:DNA-directed RNA polymerase specialized sigma24 family protein